MSNRKLLFFLFLFCCMAISPLCAGVIQGRVFYENNGPAADVLIEVVGLTTTTTNKDGYYSLNLTPGTYVFKVRGKFFNVVVYPYDSPRDFYIPAGN